MRALGSATVAAGGSMAAAVIGGLGARRAPQVYRSLQKPAWTPPSSVFGPVWTGLYTAMGLAAFRLARRSERRVLVIHAAQLALNAAWPVAFFSVRSKRASVGIVVVLDVLVAAEMVTAARRDAASAALLSPYLLWSLYATALNVACRFPDPAR